MKKFLCYVALIVLIVLIILPPVLRFFVKDKPDDNVPKDVVELLMCTKEGESINMPYKNGNLTTIKYSVVINDDNTTVSSALKNLLEGIDNTFIEILDGNINYSLDMTMQDNALLVPNEYKGTGEDMKNYYNNLGYTCDIIK